MMKRYLVNIAMLITTEDSADATDARYLASEIMSFCDECREFGCFLIGGVVEAHPNATIIHDK